MLGRLGAAIPKITNKLQHPYDAWSWAHASKFNARVRAVENERGRNRASVQKASGATWRLTIGRLTAPEAGRRPPIGDTGSVPATGDDVLIGTNNHTAIVKSAADVTIHTLEITPGDRLELNGGNFVVTDGLPFGMFGFIEVDSANFQIDGGTINNSATIDLTPSGNVTTDLTIFNTVQLNGAGSIVFAGDGNDGILGGTSAASLTNFDNNISGTGFIEGLVFTNYATIETNNSLGAGTLRIVGSAYGGSFDNENLLFADNGGTIELGDWAGTDVVDDPRRRWRDTLLFRPVPLPRWRSPEQRYDYNHFWRWPDRTGWNKIPSNDKIVSNGQER